MDFALTKTSIAPIYAQPGFRFEMVTQAILGEVLQIRSARGLWREVVLSDQYSGWAHELQLVGISESQAQKWANPELRVTTVLASARRIEDGPTVLLPCTGGLMLESRTETHWMARMPDGSLIQLERNQASSQERDIGGSPEKVVALAREFLGTPYLWGGKTRMGIDCSGFAQIVVRSATGLCLPRNSALQCESPLLGPWGKDACEIGEGHLYFFLDDDHGRVSHVGISLSQGKFIHASGCVRISSLNPQHEEFDESLLRRFLFARLVPFPETA